MSPFWSFSVENEIGNLCLDCPESSVNVLSFANLEELNHRLDEIGRRSDIKALLITSAKPQVFIAGADIKQIEAIVSAEQAFELAQKGKLLFEKLENIKIPTVCVINGACLGGGFELALACCARVASFSPQVKIGLPEVNLGILPGFGGSVRLPKLLGLLKGMPLLLAGRVVGAQEALKISMVDRLFPETNLLSEARAFALELAAGQKPRKPRKKDWMTFFLEDTPLGRHLLCSRAKKDVLQKTKGVYPAPLEIIKLLRITHGRARERDYRAESEHFSRLATTEVSKNLIKVFFLSEKYKKRRWTDTTVAKDGIRKCGIVGAGVMGGGIAQLVSSRDLPVRVKDVNEKALSGTLAEASRIYRSLLKKKKIKPHEMMNRMSLISVGLSNDGLKNCGILIEAVVENLPIKQKVFSELSSFTGPDTILASNTSSLSITRMADASRFPERVVGLHFFNPVHRMPLVEVVRAKQTSPETIERAVLFARRLGKTVIVTEDRPGFLVNRLLLPYMNEAAYLLQEGMSADQIDRIARNFGMPMGPIELIDQVGIDVGYKVAHILEESFGARMKVPSILEKVYGMKLLGKKAAKGFYCYSANGKKTGFNKGIGSRKKVDSAISNEDAIRRMIYIMINEAARCLDEKVVDSAASVDIGLIMGTGFPPFRGGLLHYADSIGAAKILKDLEGFQRTAEDGAVRFEPARYLRDLAGQGNKFHG